MLYGSKKQRSLGSVILYVLSCLDVQVALSPQEVQGDPSGDNMTYISS